MLKLGSLHKLFSQPGRLLFMKGSYSLPQNAPDSASPEYYLLVQIEARRTFASLWLIFMKRIPIVLKILVLPFFLIWNLVLFFRLLYVNALVQSYLQEHQLAKVIYEQDRHSKT